MRDLVHEGGTDAIASRTTTPDALQATIDHAPLGFAHFEPDGRVRFANRRLCDMLGYAPERLVGRSFFELTYVDDLAECIALTKRLVAGEIPSYRHEKRFIRSDGTVLWACVTVSATRDSAGTLRFLIGIAEDITEQRAAQARRREAEEHLAAALEASSTVTFRWDIGADHVECDAALLRLWGMDTTRRRLPATEFTQNVHPHDRKRVDDAIAAAAHAGGSFSEEFRVVLGGGGIRWIRDVGRVFAHPTGGLYMVGACSDVTQAREAQESIRASEARLRAFANSAPQLMWIGASDGRRSWFNDRWVEYTGLGFDELKDHGWHRVHHPDFGPRAIQGQLACFARGEVWEDSFPVRRADGVYRWFLCRAVPVRDQRGEIREWFGSNTDVTEQMEALRAAQDAKRLRDEMVAVVAHDLRNPVHTIALAAATLLTEGVQEAQRPRLANIVQQTALNMGRLLDDLLDVTRIDSGTFAVSRQPIDPNEILAAAVEQFEARAHERRISLTSQASGIPDVMADRDRLMQVFSNLVGNALKFTPSGGRIEIGCTRIADGCEFSVSDTGPGIPAAAMPHLFERFWKADPASRAGAGLGLAIARGIVEAHGGRIWVESAPGRGTTMRFTLPFD